MTGSGQAMVAQGRPAAARHVSRRRQAGAALSVGGEGWGWRWGGVGECGGREAGRR